MNLKITFDDDVSDDLKTQVPGWLESCIDWLIKQPPSPLPRQPFFETREFKFGMFGWGKGLQHSKTGNGWSYYQISDVLSVMSQPIIQRFQATTEDACKATWIFGLSQHRSDQSFEDPDFLYGFHLDMQMRWLQEFLPDIAKAVRLKRLSGQRAEKHKLQLARQHRNRQPQQPKRYRPHYSAAPRFVPAPPPKPREPVPNCKTEQDERWLKQYKAMYEAALAANGCEEGSAAACGGQ